MTFSEYYSGLFQEDLKSVVHTLPSTHNRENIQPYVIQPIMLSSKNKAIRNWSRERTGLFATALFFNVLIDQVFYTYYQGWYPRFQSLTKYPKFIGNCCTTCRANFHPSWVFDYIGYIKESVCDSCSVDNLLARSKESMRLEFLPLLEDHFPNINPEEFWDKCVEDFPV